MRKTLASMALLLAGALASSAAVTVQGLWHLDSTQPIADSSGNGRAFGSAFSTAPSTGGAMGALVVDNGAGGPLGGTGYTSVQCVQLGVGVGGKRQSAMWGIGYNPPAVNYGIEIWAMPQDNGIAGGSGGWIFSSGEGGGVALRVNAPASGPSYIDAFILGSNVPIGSQSPINTNRWTHLAIVNDNGVLTFYTNGVACGASVSTGATVPAGACYIGTPSDNQAFYGYLDEARMFTFAPGAFTTADLLLRPPGPNIVGQSQSSSVWDGGAAPFSVTASFDNTITYQWRRGGATIPGATASQYVLGTVAPADSGATFDCILKSGSLSTTSSVATLTVEAVNPSNVNAYRSAINGEPSLVAYFPADGNTTPTLVNTKDATHNGTMELGAYYDGRTARSFGQRAAAFNGDGDVQIPNNPAFEFQSGNGTIEAVVYMSRSTPDNPVIFSEGWDEGATFYLIGADKGGNEVVYGNESVGQLSWNVAPSLIGRKAHVAFVFDNGTNVTAYVDGLSLGTKSHPGLGGSAGGAGWIGAVGNLGMSNRWAGTIDELAIYSSALSQNSVQVHYSKYFYGTNTVAPTIVSQPTSKTVLAGAAPVLVVKAGGTLPLTYQWTANSVPIAGATTATLTLPSVTTTTTYSLSVQNAYGTANTTPIVLTVATPPSGYATVAMADHPTAFWRLSEGSGTTTVDSAGFNDGTYSGGFTLGAPAFHGETGTGVRLDGSSGRAIVPLSPVLNPAGAFTCEFWAAPTVTAFYVPVGSMDRPGRSGGYEFYLNGNYPGWEFHTAAGGGYSQITGDNTSPAPNSWNHVVGLYDGTNTSLYVNGVPASPDFTFPDTIVPNAVKGFYIGSRGDNVRFFSGVIANVAFYNYALSASQIANHYAVSYEAASITRQPAGVATNEWSTISLSVSATGLPNSYKWQKNGVDLGADTNPDGTAHYPNGVNGTTLVIAQVHPADSGQYRLVISNPRGGATSGNAAVSVTADTTKPAVAKLEILGTPNPSGPTPFLAKVHFTKRVDPATAGILGNYAFSGGVTPSSITLSADNTVAYLGTPGFAAGQKYSVAVTGVLDQSQTPNTSDTTPAFGWAPVLTQGVMEWDFYTAISGGVDGLLGNPVYPNASYTNLNTTVFDSAQITGGDLNNNPYFGALGDNYGCNLSGWITPTVTTNYYFYIASDDASRLFLSVDATPQAAVQIAEEVGCCHGFQEPGAPTVSAAIPLTAGVSYFISAVQTEGGGGDFVKVAWKMQGDPTASTNLTAISSAYLKAYAPLPAPRFGTTVVVGGQVKITWTGGGTLLESTDMVNWTAVAGNPPSPYSASTSSAAKKFYRVVRQ